MAIRSGKRIETKLLPFFSRLLEFKTRHVSRPPGEH